VIAFILLTFGVGGNLLEVVGSILFFWVLFPSGGEGFSQDHRPETNLKNVTLLNKGGPIPQSCFE
jgi:hypothetical protein